MTKSFFGGDLSMAHYSAHVCYKAYPLHSKERKEAVNKVREAFGRDQYFKFRKDNPKAQKNAKIKCDEYAARITRETGVIMSVSEGCFL